MIFACDGLWDVMTDNEVIQYILTRVLKKLNCKEWSQIYRTKNFHTVIQKTVKSLVQYCVEKRKSLDNVSVVLLCF